MGRDNTSGLIQYLAVVFIAAGFIFVLFASTYTQTTQTWEREEEIPPVVISPNPPTIPQPNVPPPIQVVNPPPPVLPVPPPKPISPPPPPVNPTPPPVVVVNPPPPPNPQKVFSCEYAKNSTNFYVDPTMQAVRVEKELRNAGNIADADLLQQISCRPQGTWIIGDNLDTIRSRVISTVSKATAAGKMPILVLYNIPDHTTLRYWSGITAGDSYAQWVTAVAESIGDHDAWIILEPDSIGLVANLSDSDQAVRLADLKKAILTLRAKAPKARIYLDAGHSNWRKASSIANFLKTAGIDSADGFALNVSNYQYVSDEIAFGQEVSTLIGNKHFVIDTSRNGSGPHKTEWCNAPGVTIGKVPTTTTGNVLVDALLWVKLPGESDGPCNGGVPTGKFWTERALEMIKNSPFRFE
ncbi:MAG: glycoside hydrolase family 6 protein [Patescibacteria group bacterium]